jgi:succinate-semialdehyde dehydrogenase/glutarate-semialdehyde dehydrogenase
MAQCFLQDSRCRKVSFTGSTQIGKSLIRGSAEQVTKLSLELGGSAPVLIFPDVDVDEVAQTTTRGKFRNNGQVCISATRFYVHEAVYDEYVAKVVQVTKTLKVANPLDENGQPVAGVDCGPLYDSSAVAKMEALVADATARGAQVLTGGHRPQGREYHRGYWFLPTVLVDVPLDARLTCEEVFGPILPIFRFSTADEAVHLANDTIYGLAAYVFTRDLHLAIQVTENLDFGIIGLNDMLPATAEAPFGGIKQSGMGREGGAEGIEQFLEVKYVSVGGWQP